MTYESWRVSFQSSEQAARSAYSQLTETQRLLDEANGKIAEQTQTITDMEADHNHCHEVMEQQMESERGKVKRLVTSLIPLSKYLSGGYFEPRTDEEGRLATLIEEVLTEIGEG